MSTFHSRLMVAVCLIVGCASQTAQQDAERGLRIACAGLVEAMVQDVSVPQEPLVRQVCDVERTKAMVRALVLQAKDLDLMEWPGDPAAQGDAGLP